MRWRTANNRRRARRNKWWFPLWRRQRQNFIQAASRVSLEQMEEKWGTMLAAANLDFAEISNTSWNNHLGGIVDEQQLDDLVRYGMYVTKDGRRVDPHGIFVPLDSSGDS
jgi:hypothetical protein